MTKIKYFWSNSNAALYPLWRVLIIHSFWSHAFSNQEHTSFQIFMKAAHYSVFFSRVTVFSSQDQHIKKNINLMVDCCVTANWTETVEAFLTITLFRIFLCKFLLCCGFLHTQALSQDLLHRFAADDGTILTRQPTASNHSNKEQQWVFACVKCHFLCLHNHFIHININVTTHYQTDIHTYLLPPWLSFNLHSERFWDIQLQSFCIQFDFEDRTFLFSK